MFDLLQSIELVRGIIELVRVIIDLENSLFVSNKCAHLLN